MEKRDANEREGDRNRGYNGVRMNAAECKKWLQHFREILFAEVPERETCQGDTELSRRKIGIEMSANVFGEAGALISFFG